MPCRPCHVRGAYLASGLTRAGTFQQGRIAGPGFPWGTLFVNVAGGLVIGAVAGMMAEKATGSQELRLFLTTGLLGGFTTFSAFSLEVALMWQRGEYGAALAYSLASVIVSVAAVFAGLALGSR